MTDRLLSCIHVLVKVSQYFGLELDTDSSVVIISSMPKENESSVFYSNFFKLYFLLK